MGTSNSSDKSDQRAQPSGEAVLQTTPLTALHVALGAKMVPFAGYSMPVQYPMGVLKEHQHCRAHAGLFDVSHMGQAWLIAEDGGDPARLLEELVPAELQALPPGQQRYTQFTNQQGGILDDLMVTRPLRQFGRDRLYLVVNAACKEADYAHIEAALKGRARLEVLEDRALIALQGPDAVAAASHVFAAPDLRSLPFMHQAVLSFEGSECWVSRSGYTGEDGLEISAPADRAAALAEALLACEAVEPIGLGARDSLRLEAGLCLYGHDIDTSTSPVEAGLVWSIGKRRREEGGFPGADIVQKQISDKPSRRRVGVRPDGRAPAREGVAIYDESGNKQIGTITSGGFGPTVGGPVAMGYVDADWASADTPVCLNVRGKMQPARTVTLPFVPANFYRG